MDGGSDRFLFCFMRVKKAPEEKIRPGPEKGRIKYVIF
jgi:hypothetical protein